MFVCFIISNGMFPIRSLFGQICRLWSKLTFAIVTADLIPLVLDLGLATVYLAVCLVYKKRSPVTMFCTSLYAAKCQSVPGPGRLSDARGKTRGSFRSFVERYKRAL